MNVSYKMTLTNEKTGFMGMSSKETIKRIRQKLLLTQEEFAALIGVGISTISHYEQGGRVPRMPIIRRIKEIAEKNHIKINIEDFFN